VLSGGAFGIDVPSRLQPSFLGLRPEAGRVTWERQHAIFSARERQRQLRRFPFENVHMHIVVVYRPVHEAADQRFVPGGRCGDGNPVTICEPVALCLSLRRRKNPAPMIIN
jgi:hypothetical protein